MKVILLNNPYKIYLTPRIFPNINDNLSLNLRNEMTNEVLTPTISFILGDKLEITITTTSFKVQDKYEIELLNGSSVIYRGKLIVLDDNTDIQNYEYGSQSNSKFKFK